MINRNDDPFYRPRPLPPLDLPSAEFTLFDQRPPGGSGSSNGDALPSPPPAIDEEQEADHPFAIKVEVTAKGLDDDWTTAQVGVVSGLYATAGSSNFEANGVAYPNLAYDGAVAKSAYTGFVYLLIPLVADNTNGVPASNTPNKVRAVDGGIIKLWKAPIPVWPIVSSTTLFPGVAVSATAVHIGSWGITRVNVSAGVPTYELRVQIQQNVSDNIVLGDPSEYGDVISPAPHAFQPSIVSGGITITSGYVNGIEATGADDTTVWTVGSVYLYWVKVTTDEDGIATAADVERGSSLPTATETEGYQVLFEVDATGRVTSQHVTSSLAHQMCGEEVHLFGGLG